MKNPDSIFIMDSNRYVEFELSIFNYALKETEPETIIKDMHSLNAMVKINNTSAAYMEFYLHKRSSSYEGSVSFFWEKYFDSYQSGKVIEISYENTKAKISIDNAKIDDVTESEQNGLLIMKYHFTCPDIDLNVKE